MKRPSATESRVAACLASMPADRNDVQATSGTTGLSGDRCDCRQKREHSGCRLDLRSDTGMIGDPEDLGTALLGEHREPLDLGQLAPSPPRYPAGGDIPTFIPP